MFEPTVKDYWRGIILYGSNMSTYKGINSDELDEIRKDKAGKRGKFDSNLFLIDSEKS